MFAVPSSLRPPNIPLLYLFPKHRPSLPVYKSASQHVRSLARLLLCLLSLSSPLRAPKSRDLVLSSSRLSTLVSSLWALSAISAVILRPRPRPSPDSRHFSTSRAAFDSVRRARDYPRVHRATTPVTLSARLTEPRRPRIQILTFRGWVPPLRRRDLCTRSQGPSPPHHPHLPRPPSCWPSRYRENPRSSPTPILVAPNDPVREVIHRVLSRLSPCEDCPTQTLRSSSFPTYSRTPVELDLHGLHRRPPPFTAGGS